MKATTGGGIVPALLSSKILANCIIKNQDYIKEFNKKLKKDLLISLKIRKILNNFIDKDYDYLISLCKNKKVKRIIEEFDREFPSRFIFKLFLSEPRFIYFSKHLFNPKGF